MSLKIFYGSRIEDLAEKLKDCLLDERKGQDPFLFTKVVVPNPNVAKWLQIRKFATEPCLCAGIEFPLMEKRLAALMVEGLPSNDRSRVELLPDHAYARAIVSILLEGPERQPEYDRMAPFRRYIMNSDAAVDSVAVTEVKQAAMTWQLADKLADLMDSYEVHRPEIVEAWLGNGSLPDNVQKGETAEAEAALARALWGEDGKFRPGGDRLSLRQLYDRVKDLGADDLDHVKRQTVYFFGQSTFSLLQAQILVWLAKMHDVVVFHRTPCLEYWGDIKRGQAINETAIENALLNNLGIAGKETVDLLAELDAANGLDDVPYGDVKTETVLEKVQDAIRHRTSNVYGRSRQDASVQVVGTPGIRREVEMVYNSILGSVARPEGVTGERPWPPCSFSDIAVIVPDMKTYRPMIETVFDARGEVPYGLLDTTASEDSHCLRGFLALIELGRKGLNRERLFNVLENPCVQRAMGFAREDVVKWRELTEKIGAFDGFEHVADSDGYFDWSSALRRLRLARVSDNVCDGEGNELPLVKEGGDDALKLSETVELLYRDLNSTLFDASGNPCALPLLPRKEDGLRADCWADRLSRLAKTYLANDRDDKLENKVSASLLATLYSLGDIPQKQSFELAVAALEHFVGGISCRKGGYLTSGVTIGCFSSLSALPFKQVYVMGMGAGGFPGRTSSSTLDIRGTFWRLGDVSAPNRNRFLFLESLMSVRDRLVISYPNKDIEKDAELFPSSIVLDVEKFIGEYVLDYDERTDDKDRKFQEFKGYPLLERGEAGPRKDGEKRPTDDIVWAKLDPYAGLLPTYSRAARELARARAEGTGRSPEIEKVDAEKGKQRIEISAKVLAEFLKNPVRAVMRYRFGISMAGYLETDLEADSPLGSLDPIDEMRLRKKWLDPDAKDAVEKEIRRLQLAGKMPTGFLGEYAKSAFMNKTEKGLDAIRDFVSGFAISEGEVNTLHLDFPTELGNDESHGLKVRLTAEIPNWKASDDEVTVLVAGRLDDKAATSKPSAKTQALPGECCLEPFLAYMMRLIQTGGVPPALRIGVVDLESGMTGVWRWTADRKAAEAYIELLVRKFLAYEQADGGKMLDFTCRKLLKALDDVREKRLMEAFDEVGDNEKRKSAWQAICEKLNAKEFDNSSSSFNYDLVIEQNLNRFKRECEETGEELEGIYKDLYKLPLGGIRLEAAEQGVSHE